MNEALKTTRHAVGLKTRYVQEAEKGDRNTIDRSGDDMMLTRPKATAASEHVGEETKGGGGGTGTDLLQVGGGSSGSGGGRGGSRRRSSAGGGGAGSASRSRGGRGADAGLGRVESAALVRDAGGAVLLGRRVADVRGVALGEGLLAHKLGSARVSGRYEARE